MNFLAHLVLAGATALTHLGNGLPNLIHRHHNPIWAGRGRASSGTEGLPRATAPIGAGPGGGIDHCQRALEPPTVIAGQLGHDQRRAAGRAVPAGDLDRRQW